MPPCNSSPAHLAARAQRGEIPATLNLEEYDLTPALWITRLSQADAQERSLAARILGVQRCLEAIPALCTQLQREKCLYPRLEICRALEAIGEPALPALISLLGKMGTNQHGALPDAGCRKKSYPLARDLSARIIANIGPAALPYLEEVLRGCLQNTAISEATSEATDALGWIAFYSRDTRSENLLLEVYRQVPAASLQRWKLIRAFSAFCGPEVQHILQQIILTDPLPAMRWEAVRSLGLSGGAVPPEVRQKALSDPHSEVVAMARLYFRDESARVVSSKLPSPSTIKVY